MFDDHMMTSRQRNTSKVQSCNIFCKPIVGKFIVIFVCLLVYLFVFVCLLDCLFFTIYASLHPIFYLSSSSYSCDSSGWFYSIGSSNFSNNLQQEEQVRTKESDLIAFDKVSSSSRTGSVFTNLL